MRRKVNMNSIKTIIHLLLLLLLSNSLFAQEIKEDFSAELVIINDENLKEIITNINLDDYCKREGYVWIIDFRKKNYIELTSSKKSKLLRPDSSIYGTILNDEIIFIISNENDLISIKKIGFKIDLNKFNFYDVSTGPNVSSWYFKKLNEKTELVKENIFPCVYN